MGIKIEKLNLAGSNTNGLTYSFTCGHKGEFLLGYREAGSISGKHYHRGRSKQKNPEILILVNGKARLKAIDFATKEVYEAEINAPSRIEIYPNTWHELTAIDNITFIELNSLKQHADDTIYKLPADLSHLY